MKDPETIERTLPQAIRAAAPENTAPDELYFFPGAKPVPGHVLTQRLGCGSYGEVWEAVSPAEELVALKFVSLDKDARLREQRALAMLTGVKHPRLLEVLGSWTRGDFFIIALPV